jgi:D-3-phosphoglycerate dehydrogenase
MRVLVADPIASDGVDRLQNAGTVDVRTGMSKEELIACIGDYDALVVRSETKVTADVIAVARKLRVIGRAGVGVDNIDVEAATQNGIIVLNAPTGNTIAAAEHAVAMMLALARNIPVADASMHAGKWDRKKFTGSELRGKTLGILGLGKIGYELSRIASLGLEMRVVAVDPLANAERADQAGAELVDLPRLLAESDVISVHVPLTDHTRSIIGREQLAAARKGVRIINVARGGIVDEAALAEALASGHVGGAAIDVFTTEPIAADNPLLSAPNIVLTPHLGASTEEAQINVASDVADQIVDVLAGRAARYAVNAPAVSVEDLAKLQPYLKLAAAMGSLAAQLSTVGVTRVVCSYAGELADAEYSVLTAEVLRGLFAHFTEDRVNAVNAKAVARALGIDVDERVTTRKVDHANALLIEVVGDQRLTLVGTQYEGEPRVTRVNDFRVDLQPEGIFLIGTHDDRPGVIAAISELLAKNDVNIAGIQLGRDQPRGRAVMMMQIDEPISDALLAQIRSAAGAESLRVVTL